jgi:dihydrofolate reductase
MRLPNFTALLLKMAWHSLTKSRKVRINNEKIVVAEFLSLDGVMEEPTWTAPYWNDEIAKFKFNELFASDTHLLGRVTYQGFTAAWPSRTDEQGFADRMNGLPKYVVSTTLKTVEWNNSHLIKESMPKKSPV